MYLETKYKTCFGMERADLLVDNTHQKSYFKSEYLHFCYDKEIIEHFYDSIFGLVQSNSEHPLLLLPNVKLNPSTLLGNAFFNRLHDNQRRKQYLPCTSNTAGQNTP